MEKKHKAASEFNAYVKKLGLQEKSVHEKYLGTIFTKQQTGFNPDSQTLMQKAHQLHNIQINDDPNLVLMCGYNEFDPFIKFGRDNQLFVKREILDKLREETRYTEDQIKNLKNLYTSYAEIGKGLNITRFRSFLAAIFNIENHPFTDDFFLFFDTAKDGLVDFYEMVIAMDIIEKGNFEDKAKFCFAMYDILENGVLDIFTLREVLKKSFVNQIVAIEQAVDKINKQKNEYPNGWKWEEFETDILPMIEHALPLALDRMELHKSLINELEFRFNFTLESVEHMWNLYKPTLDKGVSESRLRIAAAFSAHSPDLVTKEQFKLIMLDVFKVKDAQLVNNIFLIADTHGAGALDIRELLGNILFWLRGTIGYKFALFFEIFMSTSGGLFVHNQNLAKVLTDALKVFKECFFLAKTTADKMNTHLNGMITFDEFRDYCRFNPSSIDFLCRLTIGPYPLSDELQQKILEYQTAQMQLHYPQLMMQPNQIVDTQGQKQALPQASQSQEDLNTSIGLNRSVQNTPQPKRNQSFVMYQQQQLNTGQMMAQIPNSFQIVPLEDKKKVNPQSRINFAGFGQQQIFNYIRSTPQQQQSSKLTQPSSQLNPHKRWQPRE